MSPADPPCGIDAVDLAHVHVDQHELRVEQADEVEGLAAGRCDADHLEAGCRRDDRAEDVPEHLAVVDDEYAHQLLILGGHATNVPGTAGSPLDASGSLFARGRTLRG